MKSPHDHTAPVRFRVPQGVRPITAARIPAEILVGTPVITGLNTMLIPTALFAAAKAL